MINTVSSVSLNSTHSIIGHSSSTATVVGEFDTGTAVDI